MNDQSPAWFPCTVPLYDTTALTSALADPYAQRVSTHYYQAYLQAYANARPRTTPDGYTLSSTYVPGTESQTGKAAPTVHPRPSSQIRSPTTVKPILNHLTYGSWYQPGNCRCTRHGCPFTGTRKSVEIHMMDRHFIFPPGWKKKNDWDADPSLRGKPIAIQGTSLVLDTPEAINAWLAERKRRFPTDEKVQDKKRKLEEAVARGQLTPEDFSAGARKRCKQDLGQSSVLAEAGSERIHSRWHQRGRGHRGGGLNHRRGCRPEDAYHSASQPANTRVQCTREAGLNSPSNSDDDEAPEVVPSKRPTATLSVPEVDAGRDRRVQHLSHVSLQKSSKRTSQPKKPPRNPFVSRSTLLRNLLLPEIGVTVSNLSQAIRFLVANDFLRGVELQPGEAQEQMIEVLGSDERGCMLNSAPEDTNCLDLKRI